MSGAEGPRCHTRTCTSHTHSLRQKLQTAIKGKKESVKISSLRSKGSGGGLRGERSWLTASAPTWFDSGAHSACRFTSHSRNVKIQNQTHDIISQWWNNAVVDQHICCFILIKGWHCDTELITLFWLDSWARVNHIFTIFSRAAYSARWSLWKYVCAYKTQCKTFTQCMTKASRWFWQQKVWLQSQIIWMKMSSFSIQ